MGRQLGFLRLAVSSARNTRQGTKAPLRREFCWGGLSQVPRVLGPFS
jgi:hypothetical protein